MDDNGKIFFWKYDRAGKGYRGFHLSADDAGCNYLLKKIQHRLDTSPNRPIKAKLSSPTESVLSVPGYRLKATTWKSLEILIDHDAPNELLETMLSGDVVRITVSIDKVRDLAEGISDIKSGRGDYSISDRNAKNDEQRIWFWWQASR